MKIASNDPYYLDSNQVFEYRARLAKADPERFERERLERIEKVISSVPAERQQKLRQLQWRIDQERGRATNPISGMLRLNNMMWDFVYAENGTLSIAGISLKIKDTLSRQQEDLRDIQSSLGKVEKKITVLVDKIEK